MKYIAKVLVFNSKTQKYVEEGGIIDLSHLDEKQIEMLIKAGVVEPARNPKEKKEVLS